MMTLLHINEPKNHLKRARNECFGSLPPIYNAQETDEIYQRMEECRDQETRRKTARATVFKYLESEGC